MCSFGFDRKRTRDVLSDDENAIESKAVKKDSIQSDDDEYIGSGLEDEEGTIEEQEQHEKETTDYEGEVDALEEESMCAGNTVEYMYMYDDCVKHQACVCGVSGTIHVQLYMYMYK